MLSFRGKINTKVQNRAKNKQERQDLYSAEEFKKGLSKGNLSVGSLLFSGDDRELKIVKQLCRYLGYTYVGKEDILCQHTLATNTFFVTHYKVK